jgi:ubiquinone/menaquinone biosynthesis C-methylase UbiE
MAKKQRENNKRGHSDEYFHEGRNHWYNPDFLQLMSNRWKLSDYHSLLDVGAGMCHWSSLLAPFLQANPRIVALDNDSKWAKSSPTIQYFFNQYTDDFSYEKGTAYSLPFPDESFDVVTCQTLLIHLRSPEKALLEMKRVVRKGGIVICVEPNNRIQAILQDSSNQFENIDKT